MTLRTLQHEGKERRFLEQVPEACRNGGCALVFIVHGGSGTGLGMLRLSHFHELAGKYGFVALYPDGLNKQWNDGRTAIEHHEDDVGFFDKMIALEKEAHKIDAKRIYVTGISNGAGMSFRLACERSHVFAAIAPVANNMSEDLAKICTPKEAISMLHIVGTRDPLVPYLGGMLRVPITGASRGKVFSAQTTLRYWLKKSLCSKRSEIRSLETVPKDDTSVEIKRYPNCSQNSAIEQWTIAGGGHTWPGGWQYLSEWLVGKTSREFDASEVIWKFFTAHPKS